jgi:hypothetical protein
LKCSEFRKMGTIIGNQIPGNFLNVWSLELVMGSDCQASVIAAFCLFGSTSICCTELISNFYSWKSMVLGWLLSSIFSPKP